MGRRSKAHLLYLGQPGVLPDMVSPCKGTAKRTQGETLGAPQIRSKMAGECWYFGTGNKCYANEMQKYANHGHSIPVLKYFGNKSVAGLVTERKACDFRDELEGTVGLLKYCPLRRPPWLLSPDGARQCSTMRKRQRKRQTYCRGERRATGHHGVGQERLGRLLGPESSPGQGQKL